MHYANGREAKNGDRVIRLTGSDQYNKPVVGILHDAVALHIDDLRAAIGDLKSVPNMSKAE